MSAHGTVGDWNPELYLQFEKERGQPCIDLVARIHPPGPMTVLDVGCGPGNSAQTALERWPKALVTGIDTSPAMIETAQRKLPLHRWESGDLRTWDSQQKFDVVLSNAAIQWVPNHGEVLARLAGLLAPRGALAVQIPQYGAMPVSGFVDAVFHELAAGHSDLEVRNIFTCEPAGFYAEVLSRYTTRFELWETGYYHRMPHHRAIIDMLRSTGLRPYLDRFETDTQRAEFEEELVRWLPSIYPAFADGSVLFPFQRLFFVAYR